MEDLNSKDKTPPEQIVVAPGTLHLLGDVMFNAPLTAPLLDAYLKDRGHDPDRKWKLVLVAAVIVSDDRAERPRLPGVRAQ